MMSCVRADLQFYDDQLSRPTDNKGGWPGNVQFNGNKCRVLHAKSCIYSRPHSQPVMSIWTWSSYADVIEIN